ncbi:hypothetical protein [Naasia sp. SYSU D00948]|uniref:hypothetical protein n=1 Tax=Naasia sp. SYSU D00948 TaxID=2817379 RepID=UPI001B30FAB3|nr:hypothetical protein [Naasia sp. SYSU D00948]
MFWYVDKVYHNLDGQPLTGGQLAQVADLQRFLAGADGLAWPSAAGFHQRVIAAWSQKEERRRFWEWYEASNDVIAAGRAGADPTLARLRVRAMLENPVRHQTDIFAAAFIEDCQEVLAKGDLALTTYAAATFCARTIQVARELTRGNNRWSAWEHLPTRKDLDAAIGVLTELWSELREQEYVTASPIWDNALYDRSQSWWEDYMRVFWHFPPGLAIAERVVPGFRAIRERREEREIDRTQASSSSTFADSAIHQMVSNSQRLIDARRFDTRTIYGHPGMTTY